MFRTQVYLSEEAKKRLDSLSSHTGDSQSELIRQAVDKLLEENDIEIKREKLMAGFGIWKDRTDLPDLRKLREESNRNFNWGTDE